MSRNARRVIQLQPAARRHTIDHARSETMQETIVAVDRQLAQARETLDDQRYAVVVDVVLRRVLREADRLTLCEALDHTRDAA